MEERRNYIRIQAPILVAYKIAKGISAVKSVFRKALTKNFSEAGIRFVVYEKLIVGTFLELRIEIPFDTMPISALSEVIWTKALGARGRKNAYDVGTKFTQMQTFNKKKMIRAARRFLKMGKRYRA